MSRRSLILLEQVRLTGLVRQLVELLDQLSPLAVEPRLAVIVRSKAMAEAEQLLDELHARGLRVDLITERVPFDPRPIRRIREIIRHWRPDILETHGYKTAAYALALTRGGHGIPWVAFYHGRTTTDWKVRLYHAFERLALHQATAIAPVAHGVESHFAAADRNRLTPIPNAVVPLPAPGRNRQQARRWLGLDEGATIVGFVGRLSHEKGPDLFVRAVTEMILHDSVIGGWSGVIAGAGPQRGAVETMIREKGLEQRILLAGRVEEIRDFYEALDVLLISSRSEVFPNVLLEAVDAGIPVAASPVGGIPDLSTDLESVVVASDMGPIALSRAVADALELRGTGALDAARRRLYASYSQERRAEALLRVYDQAVAAYR